MPVMIWTELMSVGIASIDDQHKKLVAMLNDLFDASQEGKGRDILAKIMDGLIEYTQSHFKYEEDLFAKTSYADKDNHMKEHENLVKRVLSIQAKYKADDKAELSDDVMYFLQNWLTNHIMGTDQKYTEHLIAHNIQ